MIWLFYLVVSWVSLDFTLGIGRLLQVFPSTVPDVQVSKYPAPAVLT